MGIDSYKVLNSVLIKLVAGDVSESENGILPILLDAVWPMICMQS